MENVGSQHEVEELTAALKNSSKFPRNISKGEVQEYSIKALETLLEKRADDLFCKSSASVVLLELYKEKEGYRKYVLREFEEFEQRLTAPLIKYRPDPWKRFVFIKAGNSRSPLNITQEMLLHLLTYHKVMPSFLHYIFPFGNQHYVRDFHVMGFRSNTCLEVTKSSMKIDNMCRSGRHVEVCYSLKSVEHTPDSSAPWTIRQCSVYHRFDVEHEQSIWIVVKANRVIQQAVERHCEMARENKSAEDRSLPAALAVHRILAEWAGENWHWYINDLESALQDKTSRSLYISLENTVPGTQPKRSPTLDSQSSPRTQRRSTISSIRALSKVFSWPTQDSNVQSVESYSLSPLQSEPEEDVAAAIDDFSFQDLQDVHLFEVKANEALLVLKANAKVISDLRHEYRALMRNKACPKRLQDAYLADVVSFEQQLSVIEQDLAMQQNKVEILLRMMSDRKNLLQGILQMRNIQATKLLAERAQESADDMQQMTKEMHAIAKKTKVETVSMRIITFVTLFFLPGTFISTLMSTPMVKFNSTQPGFSLKNIGVGALQLYLLVSIPLVCITFLAWFTVHRLEKKWAREAEDLEKGPPEKARVG